MIFGTCPQAMVMAAEVTKLLITGLEMKFTIKPGEGGVVMGCGGEVGVGVQGVGGEVGVGEW